MMRRKTEGKVEQREQINQLEFLRPIVSQVIGE
jgi:hypothetical protein